MVTADTEPERFRTTEALNLPETMTAVRWWARGDVRVDQIPTPAAIPPDWALVEVHACGICGTDLEEYLHGPLVIPSEPHPLTNRQAPLTLGHETVGRILAANTDQAPPPGTLVAVEGNIGCGDCWWCRHQQYALCTQLASLGQMGDGGLADYMLAPVNTCVRVPSSLAVEQAVLTEPLSVVCRALRRRAGDLRGARLAVFGAGTIGLLTLQAALALGAADVCMIDPSAGRRQRAQRLGAARAVGPDQVDRLAADYPADGPDMVIECAGGIGASQTALRVVRRGGTVILLGAHAAEITVNQLNFVLDELTVTSSVSHVCDEDFPPALDLLASGAINTDALVTSTIPLSRTVTDGFETLAEPSSADSQAKIIVVPDRML